MLTISELESCVQVEGGTVITMKSGRQHWTSANLDTVEQFIALYRDAEDYVVKGPIPEGKSKVIEAFAKLLGVDIHKQQ